ncbi:MAG TPA: PAS domain S-box protein, partial [Ktedonobacteraceae bacterium]
MVLEKGYIAEEQGPNDMTTSSKQTYATSPEAEEVLSHNGQRSLRCIENCEDIVVLINAKRMVTYVSPSIASVMGYTPEEIVGSHIVAFVHPDDLDSLQRVLEELEQTPGRSLNAEYRLRCKDDSWRWFEGSGTNLLYVPAIGAIVSTFHDITKQKLVPRLNWSEMSESEHFVQFYETDDFLLDSLSSFIGTGLDAGDGCIVIATKAHRESLEQRLKANGLDLTTNHTRDGYISLDAHETLPKFMVDGLPEPKRFAEIIGSIITRAAQGRNHVRIFGELVVLLCMEGNQAAAIRLETLWNDLRYTTHPFSLFCAYPMHNFAGKRHRMQFTEICQQHSHVIPDESYTALTNPDERLRAITLLQQKAHSLQAEIAERKAAEERLRISENRYRRLFEASKDGILIVDPDTHTITDANPFMTELLGYTHEQLLGQELWQIGLFEDRENTLRVLQELQEQHVIRYETLQLHTKGGRRRYVEFFSSQYQANGHQLIQCNMRDITDRKHTEDALRASEDRFRTLANQAPLMIWQSDTTGTSMYVNTTWCQFTGLSEEESLRTGWTSVIHPEDRDTAITLWMQALANLAPYQAQFRLRRSDGIYRFVMMYGCVCSDPSGTFTGYIGTILDITEQKELDIQREAFVSMVTHELKTPLTSLQGNVQLAQRWLTRLFSQTEQLPPEQQHVLEEVLSMLSRSQQQLRIQHRLINDLLDVSRIQEDKLELRLTPCNLVELVYETVQDYQATHPSRLIILELPEQDSLQVTADRDRLRQVLSNYLTNALKFSANTEPVEVGLSLEAGDIRVWVQDHG